MDPYEEFGLSASATNEEIRQAHKNLARILHPDQYQDPSLRALAELQMKRVNSIFTGLADPHGRERLEHTDRANAPERWLSLSLQLSLNTVRRNVVWVLATIAGMAGLYWFLGTESGTPRAALAGEGGEQQAAAVVTPGGEELSRVPRRGAARDDDRALAEIRELRIIMERLQNERDAALAQLGRVQPRPPAAESGAPPAVAPVVPIEPARPSPVLERVATSHAAPGLAGTWIFVPPSTAPASSEIYPPEYIE
ncbi:MAG: J domain-containing protein, partial [Bryobacteraceae bacterium]